MTTFPILIKPAGAACNLHCNYCFYLKKQDLYPVLQPMNAVTLEALIRSYLAYPMPQHTFIWQGGEPLLMGLHFYEQVVSLQKKYASPSSTVSNCMQTNGTLVDDAMARFFAKENFLVGVSLDGPSSLHDRYRKNIGGKGSHAQVLEGLDRLRQAGAEVNILTLVSESNVAHANEVFSYILDMGYIHHQYIPCVETDAQGKARPFALHAEAWGEFLCALYDAWTDRPVLDVSIRYFDSILCTLLEGVPQLCHMGSDCRQYFVVEHNGDIFPCDFFVDKMHKLGHLSTDSWPILLEKAAYHHFGQCKKRLAAPCRHCTHLRFCGGDCLKHRSVGSGTITPARKSLLCAGYKRFFRYALPRFISIAQHIRTKGLPVPGDVARNIDLNNNRRKIL